jgi:transcriptional regulator with XRE-family HTH domain
MTINSSKLLKRFGETVRTERMRLKMTQEDLAFESGLSRTYAGDVERGEKEPSIETIARIAAALKMTGAELLAKAQI